MTQRAFDEGGWRGGKALPSVGFYRWPEIVDAFKENCYDVVEDLIAADLLILDDIGAEHDPSRNGASKLCQVLSRREYRFTLVTTNIRPDAWGSVFDARVADRLLRNSEVLTLFGLPSYAVKECLGGAAHEPPGV